MVIVRWELLTRTAVTAHCCSSQETRAGPCAGSGVGCRERLDKACGGACTWERPPSALLSPGKLLCPGLAAAAPQGAGSGHSPTRGIPCRVPAGGHVPPCSCAREHPLPGTDTGSRCPGSTSRSSSLRVGFFFSFSLALCFSVASFGGCNFSRGGCLQNNSVSVKETFLFLLALVVNDYRLEGALRCYPNNSGVPTPRCVVCFLKENVLISSEQGKYFPA